MRRLGGWQVSRRGVLMNRWQHFYDLAAAQFAVSYAQNRTISDDERVTVAKRFATSAVVFADAFTLLELSCKGRAVEPEALPPSPVIAPSLIKPTALEEERLAAEGHR